MNRLVSLVVALLFLVPATAFAQVENGSDNETIYDFPDEYVEGAQQGPNNTRIRGDSGIKELSLINIRTDFMPEMIKSVESI